MEAIPVAKVDESNVEPIHRAYGDLKREMHESFNRGRYGSSVAVTLKGLFYPKFENEIIREFSTTKLVLTYRERFSLQGGEH